MNQYIPICERFPDPTYAGVIDKDVKSLLFGQKGLDARLDRGQVHKVNI